MALLLAIDVGKRSFHIFGVDQDAVIISRKVSRAKLCETIENLNPTTVAMEACASSHFWGRRFRAAGRCVRLINPRFVKAFVKGSKNDATDAEAIYEAATRPTMRFVPVKSVEQQDLQSVHRARERVTDTRTALSVISARTSGSPTATAHNWAGPEQPGVPRPSVVASTRATSRASSFRSRGIMRCGVFGQHLDLRGHGP